MASANVRGLRNLLQMIKLEEFLFEIKNLQGKRKLYFTKIIWHILCVYVSVCAEIQPNKIERCEVKKK